MQEPVSTIPNWDGLTAHIQAARDDLDALARAEYGMPLYPASPIGILDSASVLAWAAMVEARTLLVQAAGAVAEARGLSAARVDAEP